MPYYSPRRLASQPSTQRPLLRRMFSKTIQKRWVPKVLLEAQGYYKGVCSVWIPRHTPKEPSPKPRLDAKLILVHPQQHPTVSKQWQPKAIFVTPLLQEKATVTTQASTSKITQGLSTLQLYKHHYLDDNFSWQLLQLPFCRAHHPSSHHSRTCQRTSG